MCLITFSMCLKDDYKNSTHLNNFKLIILHPFSLSSSLSHNIENCEILLATT